MPRPAAISPSGAPTPQKAVITIRQLATHTSGLEDAEITPENLMELRAEGIEINDKHMDLPGWKGQFWRKDPDPFTVSRDQTPVLTTRAPSSPTAIQEWQCFLMP